MHRMSLIRQVRELQTKITKPVLTWKNNFNQFTLQENAAFLDKYLNGEIFVSRFGY